MKYSSRRLKREKSKEAIVVLLRNTGKNASTRVIGGPCSTPGKKRKVLRPFLLHRCLRVKNQSLGSNPDLPGVNTALYRQSIRADWKGKGF